MTANLVSRACWCAPGDVCVEALVPVREAHDVELVLEVELEAIT